MTTRIARRRFTARTAALGAFTLVLAACSGRATQSSSGGDVATEGPGNGASNAALAAWPAKQRETAMTAMGKYGQPDVMGDPMIGWFGKGPFVKTTIMRQEVAHAFPMPHVDYLMQTVKYRVPTDKYDELAEFDGSVIVHRTRGELSAQCDKEEMNLLALNLAHDVATGKRTVQDARAFYAKTAMAFMGGDKSSPYVQGLIFQQDANAADPDQAHRGM